MNNLTSFKYYYNCLNDLNYMNSYMNINIIILILVRLSFFIKLYSTNNTF